MIDTPPAAELVHPPASVDGTAALVEAAPPPLLTMADLRFFATCYLAGLIFFLVMLS